MFPVIHIGPLAFQSPGLILLLGYWMALEVIGRQGARRGLEKELLYNAGFYAAVAGIIGARLGYAVLHWSVYRENLVGILALSPQALDPIAGGLAGLLVALVYLLGRKKIPFWPLLDATGPGLAVMVSALALANFAGGDAYGSEASLPWAVELWGARRHPVQLYELAAGLVSLLLLWRVGRAGGTPVPGALFLLWVLLYGATRWLLEPFRASSVLIWNGLRLAQVTGLSAALLALGFMRFLFVRAQPPES